MSVCHACDICRNDDYDEDDDNDDDDNDDDDAVSSMNVEGLMTM